MNKIILRRRLLYAVSLSALLTLTAGVTAAQTRSKGASGSGSKSIPETKPTLYSRLFQNPTHNNGYEE